MREQSSEPPANLKFHLKSSQGPNSFNKSCEVNWPCHLTFLHLPHVCRFYLWFETIARNLCSGFKRKTLIICVCMIICICWCVFICIYCMYISCHPDVLSITCSLSLAHSMHVVCDCFLLWKLIIKSGFPMFHPAELLVDGVCAAEWWLLPRPTHLDPWDEAAPCRPAALKPERPLASAIWTSQLMG